MRSINKIDRCQSESCCVSLESTNIKTVDNQMPNTEYQFVNFKNLENHFRFSKILNRNTFIASLAKLLCEAAHTEEQRYYVAFGTLSGMERVTKLSRRKFVLS